MIPANMYSGMTINSNPFQYKGFGQTQPQPQTPGLGGTGLGGAPAPATPAPTAPAPAAGMGPGGRFDVNMNAAPPNAPGGTYALPDRRNFPPGAEGMRAWMAAIQSSYTPVPMGDPNYNGLANAMTANPFTNAMGMAPVDLNAIIAAGRERAATFDARHPRANMVSPPGGGPVTAQTTYPGYQATPPATPGAPAPGAPAADGPRYMPLPYEMDFQRQIDDIRNGVPAHMRPNYNKGGAR